jgi:hypothetical protein
LPNPLAIGVTLGGLLLDVVVPRPKPRAGLPLEPSLLSRRAVPRTPQYESAIEAHGGHPVASGGNRLRRLPLDDLAQPERPGGN